MIDVDYNEYKETIEENMKLIQENHKLKEEIERLNAELELYKDNQIHLNNQLEKRDNIIKEVREYINKNGKIDLNGYDLLEILDKVGSDKK